MPSLLFSSPQKSGYLFAAMGALAFCLHTVPASAQPPAAPDTPVSPVLSVLTLRGAIALALARQPSLLQADASLQAAQQRLNQAKATYYPTLAPNYSYTNNFSFTPTSQLVSTTDPVTGETSQTFVTVSRGRVFDSRQGDISLSYRLFDNTRELASRQSRQNLRATTFGTQDTRQSVIAAVAAAYFQALQTEALVRVSQAQVARAQNTLAVITAQVEVGIAARKDTLQAQADLLNAQVNLLQSQNNSQIAQVQLRSAIGILSTGLNTGLSTDTDTQAVNATAVSAGLSTGGRLPLADVPAPSPDTPLTADLEGSAPAAASAVAPRSQGGSAITAERPALSLTGDASAAVSQLLSVAYRLRPDVAQARQNLEVAKTSVRLRQTNAGLQLSADVGAGYQVTPTVGNNRQFNIAATYPLFDGGLVRSQTRESQAGVRSSEAQLQVLSQQIAVSVEQSFRSLALARASLPAALSAQEAAQTNYDAALASQREGVGSIVEVITAQTALVQAQTSYVQAVYTFYSADAALARAVGQADRIGINTPEANTSLTDPANTPAPADAPAATAPVKEGSSGTP